MNDQNYYVVQFWMVSKLNLSGNELVAFAVIYGFSQDRRNNFNGNYKYISKWTGMSERTTRRTIQKLFDKKLVKRTQKDQYNYSYWPNWEVVDQLSQGGQSGQSEFQGGQSGQSQGGQSGQSQGGQNGQHNKNKNKNKNKNTREKILKKESDEFGKTLTEKAKEKVLELLPNYSFGKSDYVALKSIIRRIKEKEKSLREKKKEKNPALSMGRSDKISDDVILASLEALINNPPKWVKTLDLQLIDNKFNSFVDGLVSKNSKSLNRNTAAEIIKNATKNIKK